MDYYMPWDVNILDDFLSDLFKSKSAGIDLKTVTKIMRFRRDFLKQRVRHPDNQEGTYED
jgi:hypothetical protein